MSGYRKIEHFVEPDEVVRYEINWGSWGALSAEELGSLIDEAGYEYKNVIEVEA
jgi:hypothetical protein